MPVVTVQVQEHPGGSLPAVLRERTASAAASAASPRPYDFRRPSTLAREHSRVLEVAFDTFARQWGTQLSAKVRMMAQISCEQVIMLRYDDHAAALPAETAMVLCGIAGSDAKAVLQFPAADALAWITCMLGGSLVHGFDERRFTPIEHALIRRVIDDTIEDLGYSLGPLCPVVPTFETIHHNSRFAQAAGPAEAMIVARFTIRIGDRSTAASIALPASVLLPQLGSTAVHRSPEHTRTVVREQLSRVPVTVDVRFAPARVTPERVLALAIGDVLPLPHPDHRPVDVSVGGTVIARAAVGTSGARLACVVVSTEENPV